MTIPLTDSQFRSTAAGIPCIVDVVYFEPGLSAKFSGHPDSWEPPESGDIDIEILDRRGRRAEWLEAKLSAKEREALEEKAYEFMESR